MGSPYFDDGSFYNRSLCQLMAYPIQAAPVIRAQPETSALGQQQTSKPFGIHVGSALNIGSQLLTVDTSALGHEQTCTCLGGTIQDSCRRIPTVTRYSRGTQTPRSFRKPS